MVLVVLLGATTLAQQPINPRQQPGATVHIFAPEQHDLYDGHFVISANRIYMVGGLNDPEGWDHLDSPMREIGDFRRGLAFIAQQSGRRALPVGRRSTRNGDRLTSRPRQRCADPV